MNLFIAFLPLIGALALAKGLTFVAGPRQFNVGAADHDHTDVWDYNARLRNDESTWH